MEGLGELWTTISETFIFGAAGQAAEEIPDFWATTAINWSAIIAGIVMLGMFLYGGFMYIISAGDPQKAEQAQKTLVNAVIGFALVVLAWTLASLIMSLFGVTERDVSGGGDSGLPDGSGCEEDWDCAGGWCNSGVCM